MRGTGTDGETMCWGLIAILLAVPFGSLSEKWGRKPVGTLAIVGLFLVTVSYEAVCEFYILWRWNKRNGRDLFLPFVEPC